MKLERINENQIRCTLSSTDLSSRKLKLSELAYGTEKTKALFQDLMQQAHNELGFDADGAALMIEAIPIFPDSIILQITKVDDPEELDTRFSKFTPDHSQNNTEEPKGHFVGADDILDLFHRLFEMHREKENTPEIERKSADPSEEAQQPKDLEEQLQSIVQICTFTSLDDAILAARSLKQMYNGRNSLYKNAEDRTYQLVLHPEDLSPDRFNKVCNILSEYGTVTSFSPAEEAFLQEHKVAFLPDCALQQLAIL